MKVPAGACDTHMHFYEANAPVPPGTFMPGVFTVEDYRAAVQKRLGLERVVVVQANAYRDDNSVVLNAIAKLGAAAKGVAVVRASVAEGELERLTKGGICGVRIMTLHGGTLGFDAMDELMARVHPFGWHANIQLDGRELPKYRERLSKLPVDLVIDHNGKFLEPVAVDHPAFRVLLELLDGGRAWVKLAAPYETSKVGPPGYDDVSALARALVQRNPQRCLWASNWPHPNRNPAPANAAMLDLLLDWAGNEATARRILADNPARLYFS